MNERRHVCVFCGSKRIESKMQPIEIYTPFDNIPQGQFWACYFKTYMGELNHVFEYAEHKAKQFYLYGDKFKSLAEKSKRANFKTKQR